MNDPRNAIQDAIYAALNGAGVTALVDPDDSDDLPYTVFRRCHIHHGSDDHEGQGRGRGDAYVRELGYKP